MAALAVEVGTGSTIAFGTSSWTGNLLSLAWGDITRDTVDTSHMSTPSTAATNAFGTQTFMPVDIADTGTLTAEVQFNPDPGAAGVLVFPIQQIIEEITVTFPNAETWVFDGFCTNVDMSDPMEDVMTATLTIRVTGGATITP